MTKRLSKARHAQLCEYMGDLQHRLGLCQWKLHVAREFAPKSMGVHSHVVMGGQSHEAYLNVAAGMFQENPSAQRQILVHELCHLVMVRVEHTVADHARGMRKRERESANASWKRAMEQTVDDFAYLIHESVPLPPKWKP